MLRIKRFINELMTSNCYILWDEEFHRCIVIDPASEKSLQEIAFMKGNKLIPDFILLTHEHTDHTWGVNSILDVYPTIKVVCHKIAKDNMVMESTAYFRLYYDNPTYSYRVKRVDLAIDKSDFELVWNNISLRFIHVPGHSMGSVCILVNNWLFTGDTILLSKTYINKRNGSKVAFKESQNKLLDMFDDDQLIYPGHGKPFRLVEYKINIKNKINLFL